jgi:oligoribonuclease NrnB/cAMP/cGMP phosphodiesterase (DHH superfamily)
MSQANNPYSHLQLLPDDVDFIIDHGNCSDGFAASSCAYLYFSERYPGEITRQLLDDGRTEKITFNNEKTIFFHHGNYSYVPPNITGRNVLLVDFSYSFKLINEMILVANKLAIIDHHISAAKNLETLDDKYKLFDMNHSGAYLAWKFFFPIREVPSVVLYVQDHDIWTHVLPLHKEYMACYTTMKFDYEIFKSYMLNDELFLNKLKVEGPVLIDSMDNTVSSIVKHAAVKFMFINNKYYFVAHVNSVVFKSEVGNMLCLSLQNIDFAAVYSIDDICNGTLFSLRSIKDRTDVTQIASLFGGGGHYCAAGCKINSVVSAVPAIVLDNNNIYNKLNNIYFSKIKIGQQEYDCVYMNSMTHKDEIAHYLLQMRNDTVQECVSIHKNKTGQNITNKVHVSAIWNYNAENDKTWFNVYINPELSPDEYSNISHYIGGYIKNDMLNVEVNGLKHVL